MRAVFLDQQTFSEKIKLNELTKQVSSLNCFPLTHPNDIIKRSIDADIIITNKVILNEQTLANLPKLKLICIAATGTNNVDIDAAKKYNIAVTNVSGYAKQSVAQYVFSQILAYFSQVEHHNKNVELGLWQQSSSFCFHGQGSQELAGKTLGLIGYGSLAKAVEKIALAFDMHVMIADRSNSSSIRAGRHAFNDVIKKVDVLSLHCPQTPETEGLINKDIFQQMKSSAILINTARGAIINEVDLFNALNNNDIAFAILDVLSQEPPSLNNTLLIN
ncbi:MAG: D-2-hydroxyacid dehydrogenase, partial [Colwelliaceae bacterium]|nr:D-2-hydroxyacid dehydrogenase [Colwelliaceae bacterium]